jgi:microcystin degradation protein MlrC
MRAGILMLMQESNTFLREPTTLQHFQADLLLTGEAVREALAGTHHETAGFFAGLADAGIEAVPIFAARAYPFGVVAAEAFGQLLDRMMRALDDAGPLDGLLVAPHGATVSADYPDADGHWLSVVRRRLGPDKPIIGTLDLHANLSPLMVASTDALIAYRSNPHMDQKQRGLWAAHLLARTLRGKVRPTQAAAYPPLAINIECQLTTAPPCLPHYQNLDDMLGRPGVLANSILLGYPYADVAEMGSSVLFVTDNDRPRAQALADELAGDLWAHRHDFAGRFVSVEAALEQARSLEGPICLLDMGDNIGGGSPGDGTWLAHALQKQPLGPAFVCLFDPAAVQAAQAAGVGREVTLAVGGKCDERHGPPLPGRFWVVSLHDGRFEEPQPRHGGIRFFDMGPTAVLRDGALTVQVTTRRMVPFSLGQLTSCGLEPREFRVLVAKGVIAPVAAYAPVCKHLLRVDTPGVTSADLQRLTYQHRRRPMFPFEDAACGLAS